MSGRVAEQIADALVAHGVDRAFSVPGESFLPLLDALHGRNDIDLVTCRHEGSAALAAVADAKLTGRPGVAMVSRGPGAFNAGLGLHVAEQEAIPLVLLVGQVDLPSLGRGAVQEIDTAAAFSGTLKLSICLRDPARVAEEIARAFSVARSGTPGPVVIELPEDLLAAPSMDRAAAPRPPANAEPSDATIRRATTMIDAAERPLLIVGGECRSDAFREALIAVAERLGTPVAVTNKNQDQFPNRHALFVGQMGFFASPAQLELFEKADLLVAVGTRLGDLSSFGFAIPRQGHPSQTLIHVYPDGDALGRRFDTALPVVATADAFVGALLDLPRSDTEGRPDRRSSWLAEIARARERVHGWNPDAIPPEDVFGHVVSALAAHADPDCVVTTDSGNFAAWVHRIFKFSPANRLLGSGCGAMGTGVPSGLAASLRFPGRQVIAFCGDGGFLMTGNELATAVARGADLKIVVSNNRSYGTIRSYQEKAFPGRVSGTDLGNPDFAALARAFGATGLVVSSAEQVEAVVQEALGTAGAVVIEVRCDVLQTLETSVRAMAGVK